MEELVSVIITTYGRRFDVIIRSINSAISQTYRNIEIILIDDNKKDSEYRKDIENNIRLYPQVIYIKHDENKGAQVARNTGIDISNGTYVAFLDDDDEWMNDKIEKQLKLFQKDVGLVFSKGYCINESTGKQTDYVTTRNFKTEVTFEELLYADYIGTTTQALIPKNVLMEVGGFDLNQPARQDYEMWIKISKKFRCVGVDEPLFKHYIHLGEQISKSNIKAIAGMENIYNMYKDDYKKNIVADSHMCYLLGKRYLNNKKFNKAFMYYIKSLLKIFKALIFENKKVKIVFKEHLK